MKSKTHIPVMFTVALAGAIALSACSPEVGSKEWCDAIKEKDKGQLTVDEAKNFAQHCVIGGGK